MTASAKAQRMTRFMITMLFSGELRFQRGELFLLVLPARVELLELLRCVLVGLDHGRRLDRIGEECRVRELRLGVFLDLFQLGDALLELGDRAPRRTQQRLPPLALLRALAPRLRALPAIRFGLAFGGLPGIGAAALP